MKYPYYTDGKGIIIYNDECLEVMRGFEDKSFDLVLTDPPYGINKEGIIGDDLPLKEYRNWMKKIITEIERISIDGYFIFHSEIMLFKLADLYNDCRLFASCNNFANMSRGMPYAWSPIVFKIKDKKSWMGKGRNWFISNTANMINTPKNIGHPTPKPLDVMEYIIGQFDSNLILDPFVGSGTTLVAAKMLGRKATGIEISEKYCEIAKKRLVNVSEKLERFI